MGNHGPDVLADLRLHVRELRRRIPSVYEGFAATHHAALTDGALDTKTKELMALSISVAQQCDGCIASHARGAHRAGATEQEVAEAIGVAILMAGGPATIYGPRALAAFQAFADGTPTTG
jgi:AhpD family alkylhydroperoxidase